MGELELPALVVQRRDLVGGKGVGVQQGGEERLGAEPLTLIGDGSRDPDLGQAGILLASLAGDVHLDERISGTEALENAPALVLLGADEPVTIRAIAGQRDQDPSRQEAVGSGNSG